MRNREELFAVNGLSILVNKNMLYKNTIESLKKYIEKYPDTEIVGLLSEVESNEKIIKRENVTGHMTASGLVFLNNKLLLIFHKKLQKYLQPGGHLEDDSSLVEAAQREVLEETGVQTIPYKFEEGELVVPIHVDVHTIPHNEKKNEPEHFHYDCMFLLLADSSEINLQESEVDGYKWVDLDYQFKDVGIVKAVKKIKELNID